jgi:class 3 adenylate cyclase
MGPPITTVSSFESHGEAEDQLPIDRQETNALIDDQLPPSESLVKGIEDLIQDQFPMMETEAPAAAAETTGAAPASTSGQDPTRASAVVGQALQGEFTPTSIFFYIVENNNFQRFFMTLTFYALFIPDLDLVVGTKQTAYIWSILTFGVMILFFLEIFIQCKGKPRYLFSAYFWLDIVASVSLLPDTWLFQELMFRNNAFVAGRSSRITRMIRIASRSSRATRLNRLTRIVRVASLMPRLRHFFEKGGEMDEAEKMLNKKLRRLFLFLDEDMDGKIPQNAVIMCLNKLKLGKVGDRKRISKVKNAVQNVINIRRTRTPGMMDKATQELIAAGGNPNLEIKRKTSSDPGADPRIPSDELEEHLARAGVSSLTSEAFRGTGSMPVSSSTGKTAFEEERTMSEGANSKGRKSENLSNHDKKIVSPPLSKSPDGNEATQSSGLGQDKSVASSAMQRSESISRIPTMVSFEEFQEILRDSDKKEQRLLRACQQSLRRGNNMWNLTSRLSEYVAVKVALGVLALLFVLPFVEPDVRDLSAERGVEHLELLVKRQAMNGTMGLSQHIHDQVDLWLEGDGPTADKRQLLYMDLDMRIYCDVLLQEPGTPCSSKTEWLGIRESLEEIDERVFDSDVRRVDMELITKPAQYDSDDEVTSVAVLNRHDSVVIASIMSLATTVAVILLIVSGITIFTNDLNFLSKNLLRPLRDLADDMGSIAQLEIAGFSAIEDDGANDSQTTSEVRLMKRTFEHMKKAIISWGKYVPWPVVRLLLRAGVEAELGVQPRMVTMFFSDIASFTTIVESLPPEGTLLLLSRYFNDMSKIIDDNGGIVLEFIGDAILAIYGAPLANEDHAATAVKAVLKMQACLAKINQWSARRDLPEIKIRCGVHTGQVLVGNMGFRSRMKYGIVGEEVNIPSRLEEINKTYKTDQLISEATKKRLPTGMFLTRPVDYLQLHQDPQASPSLIFEVMGLDRGRKAQAPWREQAELHQRALELYRRRDFESAENVALGVHQSMSALQGKPDEASMLLVRRCRALRETPPPENWDGVWQG